MVSQSIYALNWLTVETPMNMGQRTFYSRKKEAANMAGLQWGEPSAADKCNGGQAWGSVLQEITQEAPDNWDAGRYCHDTIKSRWERLLIVFAGKKNLERQKSKQISYQMEVEIQEPWALVLPVTIYFTSIDFDFRKLEMGKRDLKISILWL